MYEDFSNNGMYLLGGLHINYCADYSMFGSILGFPGLWKLPDIYIHIYIYMYLYLSMYVYTYADGESLNIPTTPMHPSIALNPKPYTLSPRV